MKKIIENFYKEKVINTLIIIFPFIELITSISIKNFNPTITVGMVYKLFLLFYAAYYILFIDKKNKKVAISVFVVACIISIGNLFFTLKDYDISSIILKAVELSKYMAFPIYLMFFIAYIKNGNRLQVNTVVIVAVIYSILLFLAYVTGTSEASRHAIELGRKGWFKSANELGILLTILYPMVLYKLIKNPCISKYIGFTLCNFALLDLGTKAALLGVYGTLLATLLFFIYKSISFKGLKNIKDGVAIVLITICIVTILLPLTPTYKYAMNQYASKSELDSDLLAEQLLYTGRQHKLEKQLNVFRGSNVVNRLFGIKDVDKTVLDGDYMIVERDFHDILFTNGILGLALYVCLIFAIIIKFATYILKNIKEKLSLQNFLLICSIGLSIVGAYIAGHTFSSPTVSLFIAIIFAYSFNITGNNLNIVKNPSAMFICSVGGHLTQMLQIKQIFSNYNYVLVTEKTDVTKNMNKKYKIRYLLHGTRKYIFKYIFIELFNILKSIYYFMVFSPEVIVTTGTHTAVPMCFIAKFFGKKVIFIESFAKRTSPTKSGKLVYKIADTFVIQWDSLKEIYPKAEVWGWIY